jgi:hypothetical protein
MNKVNEVFKAKVVEALSEFHGDVLAMDDLEMLNDDQIAVVPISALTSGGLPVPDLLMVGRGSDLFIEAHELVNLGSPGSLMNCLTAEYLRDLFYDDVKKNKENDSADFFKMRLVTHAYLSSVHTADELLLSVIQSSNAVSAFTTAIKDPHDGEIFVRARMSCNFEGIPEDFEGMVGAVLDHASRIRRFVKNMRRLILPDTTNWEDVASAVLGKFSERISDKCDETPASTSRQTPKRATL